MHAACVVFSLVSFHAYAFEPFEACDESHQAFKAADSSPLECHSSMMPNGQTINAQQLKKIQMTAYSQFDHSKHRLANYVMFSQSLRGKVLDRLRGKLKELETLSSCRPTGSETLDDCTRALARYRLQVRGLWPNMLSDLSLAHPREINPHMFNSKVTWFNTHPKHPFPNSENMPPLTPEERNRIEEEFLKHLGKEVPEVAPYLATKRKTTNILTESTKDEALIKIAMVKIRNDSRERYIETIRQNPLLTFIGNVAADDPASPSDQALQVALAKMKAEVEQEIAMIEKGDVESERRILKYRNIANEVLAAKPQWCSAATTAQKVAADEESSAQFKESAFLVGASVLTLVTCSTLVLCGASGAAIGALDYGLAMDKSNRAFHSGLVGSTVGQDSDSISQAADHRTAAGASLAISAVSALTGGATLLKDTTIATTKAAVRMTQANRARREVSRVRAVNETSQHGWLPASAQEMAAYSRQHISEVQSQAQRLFEKHQALFPSLSKNSLKMLKQHDKEKVLDFKTLRDRHGYQGIPTELLKDHQDFTSWVSRQSADGKHIEMSLNEALQILWGQNPGTLARGAQAAKSQTERVHWNSMGKLRDYVIENLNRIDGEIMETAMRRLRSPEERVEMRLVEFLADLTARSSNPLTQFEFGRGISSTSAFMKQLGRDGLISKLAGGSSSPAEIQAAKRLLERVSPDEIADIATWLETK